MRAITSLFRPSAPSAEFGSNRPNISGAQVIWKRIFEHIMERADVYKRSGFSNLHDANKELEEDLYLDLRVAHDALSIERDDLMDAFNNPEKLSAELVSRASGYKSRTKAFYIDVQKALEAAHDKRDSPWSMVEPLSSYRFPDPADYDTSPNEPNSTASEARRPSSIPIQPTYSIVNHSVETPLQDIPVSALNHDANFECHTNSVLGLYNVHLSDINIQDHSYRVEDDLVPLSARDHLQESNMRSHNGHISVDVGAEASPSPIRWFDDMLFKLPASIDIDVVRELLLTLPHNSDEQTVHDFGAIVGEFAPALDGQGFVQEFLRRRRSYDPRTSYECRQDVRANSASYRRLDPSRPDAALTSSPRSLAIPALRPRTFPLRTQDSLDGSIGDAPLNWTPGGSASHY